MKHLTSLKYQLCFIVLFLYCLQVSCKKHDAECADQQIRATTTSSQPCIAEGTIEITYPLATDNRYSLGNNPFQESPVFLQLLPGEYRLSIQDKNRCVSTRTMQVGLVPVGALFAGVKSLLAVHCVSCHGGNNPQAGLDFNVACDILKNWDRIKERAVNGNPSPMPQGGLLNVADRNKITAWIDAGHRYTD